MSEWRNIWTNSLPNEGRSPISGHRMAAEGMQFPWRWNGGTISMSLEGIWAKTNIQNVIGQGLADAAAAGRDYAAQTEEGVRAVRQICPDMTVSEALTTVDRVRQS